MSEISRINSSTNDNKAASSVGKGEYSKLKKEYDLFKKKAAKSDLANSPVLKEKELELLAKLKSAALEEGKSEELSYIEQRETELNSSVVAPETQLSGVYYRPVSFNGAINVSEYSKNLEEYADSRGFIDEQTWKIINAFGGQDCEDVYHVSYLIKKCRDNDETITPDKTDAIEILAKSGVSPAIVPQLLEEFTKQDADMNESVDLQLCSKMAAMKQMGFDDTDSLKFVRFLGDKFLDEASVKSSIKAMSKSGIAPDAIVKILDALSVEDNISGGKKVSSSAVKSVITLKKALAAYRNNEKAERDNPINQLNVVKFQIGDNVMVMKNNEITYITPTEGETVHNLKQEYEDLISKIEDNLLSEYAMKYKNADGGIDSKYLRTLIGLRNAGICYDQLFPMADFCIDDNGINKDKIDTIGMLKAAGALGTDIMHIMSAIQTTAEGKYNAEDVKNACDLSSSVIGGKEVSALLPEVRGRENVKDFFMDFSPFFETKYHLLEVLPLIKNEKGEIDENAMDVLYNLAANFFAPSDNVMSESDFLNYANDIIYASMDDGEVSVNDEGAGICSIMCQNRETPENILAGLNMCKNENGKIDEQLAEILWDMSSQQADIKEIEHVIEVCKSDNGSVLYNITEYVISLFESGADKEKVMQLAEKLHQV